MYNCFLTREAKEDLWRIYEFGVYKFGEVQADKYFNLINDCFDKIASNPFMFPETIKNNQKYRFCVCGVDTIYYKINNDAIEIITIIGRQNF
ncbi:type II toxin-antitoxin system RelE/ParE family toxin [Flavobacterium undicola]|uniref:type II toxin-antitoxin system RelE/ParE family toxin n=1 Tax=Flavobacterium undicola TaxID=1932779 RepID=UPI0013790370|nr:type II toxin-antitoxin system RelE/ParE family toxin [Flavobacterium undicola]MBA0883992.1 type II toxin-antitoxin system RelE/ParE family toxin [Flavobacterium undicola]